jgi:hypothetical protein
MAARAGGIACGIGAMMLSRDLNRVRARHAAMPSAVLSSAPAALDVSLSRRTLRAKRADSPPR